jgi:hypothetical protein
MSREEFHTGKLVNVRIETDLEATCRAIATRHSIELAENWKEEFRDAFNEYEHSRGKVTEEYFIHGEKLYRVIDHEESEDEEYFMKLKRNHDGSLSFIGKFYNGGTCFSEMLEEALDEMAPSFQEQIHEATQEIVENHQVASPKTVPSAGRMILDYLGKEKAIELFEGAAKETAGDVFKSSAYEATLERIIKKEDEI